jgi:hypothetical protein
VLDDPDDPDRARYLSRFADFEGRTFERRFFENYRGDAESFTADSDFRNDLDPCARGRDLPIRRATGRRG